MRRRVPASTAAPVTESFADYLAECPAPADGWTSYPHAVRVRAVLYVQRTALADGRSPYKAAESIAASWLRDSQSE